jgi:NAD(P)-dependent dehydrogenase (short-subunit alcohol dehydrogenase family)
MAADSAWTSQDMPDQTGRIAVVTGANSGIGYQVARTLAYKGATVLMACRDEARGSAAAERIRAEQPQGQAELMQLDLADLGSVQRFAREFQEERDRLDLLINNAGVMMPPRRLETADGFELQLGTNHLGHFALTGLLLDCLLRTPGARVVTVSSSMHVLGRIDFDDLQAERSYSRWRSYGQSKLANLLFVYELQRRLEASGAGVLAAAAHPGWTATELQRYSWIYRVFNPLFAQRPEMGCLPTLYATTAADVQGGDYFGPDGFLGLRGSPKRVRSSSRSHDRAVAARLWSVSEDLIGVRYAALGSRPTTPIVDTDD